MKRYSWQFDEFQQVGRDYGSAEEAKLYDEMHAQFRDIAGESRRVLDRLDLKPGAVVLDIGCGTGTFAIEAAKRGLKAHAADVSVAMLACAKEKAREVIVDFHHAGFLTLEMNEGSIDAITTTYAFHHLPDFWKGVALKRLYQMLKPSGRLYLKDVVLEEQCALENIETLIVGQAELGGDLLREDAEGHFREENSTYDWVMEGMLERAGFRIEERSFEGGVIGTYLCCKRCR